MKNLLIPYPRATEMIVKMRVDKEACLPDMCMSQAQFTNGRHEMVIRKPTNVLIADSNRLSNLVWFIHQKGQRPSF